MTDIGLFIIVVCVLGVSALYFGMMPKDENVEDESLYLIDKIIEMRNKRDK